MKVIQYQPIGVIHTSLKTPKDAPIQPRMARDVAGTVELLPEYEEGLSDLDGFSHIILICHLHLSEGFSLKVKPFLDNVKRGLFATRAPRRPNPIGISVVRLNRIEGAILHILDIDIVDGTPLLDIKPHIPDFELSADDVRIGWLSDKLKRA